MASGCITYISYFLVPQTFDASWKPVCLYGLWTGGILSFLWSYLCVSWNVDQLIGSEDVYHM